MDPKVVAIIEEHLEKAAKAITLALREHQGNASADWRAEHAWANGSRSAVIWSGTPNRPYIRIAVERLS